MLYRYIFGDDIFISYARADGLVYAQGLASELAGEGFSCRVDLWHTDPGIQLPDRIRRAVRNSSLLVVVGTAASCQSEPVGQEISEFLRTGRNLVPIGFPEIGHTAVWSGLVKGLPWASEQPERLTSGMPSSAVLGRVRNSLVYTRRTARLKRASIGASMITGLLGLGTFWLSTVATRLGGELGQLNVSIATQRAQLKQAQSATSEAQEQARRQQELADEARREAARQLARANATAAIADSRAMAAQAMAALDSDPAGAMRLSVSAQDASDTFESRRALLASLQHTLRLTTPRRFAFQKAVTAWAIDPTRQWVATQTQEGILEVWNYATAAPVRPPGIAPSERINSLAFLPHDGLLVSAALGGQLAFLRPSSPQHRQPVNTGAKTPRLLAIDSSGGRLAYSDDDELFVMDIRTGAKTPVKTRERAIRSAAFSPDGRSLAWGDDNEWTKDSDFGAYSAVHVTDTQTGETRELKRSGREKEATSLAFSRDGAILATGWGDGRVLLWRTSDRSLLHDPAYITRHGRMPIKSLAFSPDGSTLASLSASGLVLWNMEETFGTRVSPLQETQLPGLTSVSFDRTGRSVHAVGETGVMVWDLASLALHQPGPAKATPNDFRLDMSFDTAGRSLHASTDAENVVWRQVPGVNAERTPIQLAERTRVLTRNPAHKLAVVRNAAGTFLLDNASGEAVFQLAESVPQSGQGGAAIDRRGLRVALAVALNAASEGRSREGDGETTWRILVWDIPSRRLILTADTSHGVTKPKFSDDGQTIAFASRTALHLLSIGSGKWRQLKVHAAEAVASFAFSVNGSTLATGGKQGSIALWDAASLKRRMAPWNSADGRGQEFAVVDLAFNPSGNVLAAVGGDGKQNTTGLWDVQTGRLLGTLKAPTLSTLRTAEFNGDGRVLASAGVRSDPNRDAALRGAWEHEVIFWDVAPDSWAKTARLASGRR